MSIIEWDPKMSVGVREIDDQHKQIIKLINNLDSAFQSGKGRQEVKKVMGFLDKYIIDHFAYEEIFMEKYNYPEYAEVKQEHDGFIREFTESKNEYGNTKDTHNFINKLREILVPWLTNHIAQTDMKMAQYLKPYIEN
ncbi:bacteriohemerythrin [bacterium]|nr:bacteriohemerythrin [bacterium]